MYVNKIISYTVHCLYLQYIYTTFFYILRSTYIYPSYYAILFNAIIK